MSIYHLTAWPLHMRAATAAAYVDEETADDFLRGVALGHYPPPIMSWNNQPKWHRAHLDTAVDRQHGITPAPFGHDLIDLI